MKNKWSTAILLSIAWTVMTPFILVAFSIFYSIVLSFFSVVDQMGKSAIVEVHATPDGMMHWSYFAGPKSFILLLLTWLLGLVVVFSFVFMWKREEE